MDQKFLIDTKSFIDKYNKISDKELESDKIEKKRKDKCRTDQGSS